MPADNKRLRVMAGPNGSGKSTILKEVRGKFHSGPFVNADEIEELLQQKQILNLSDYDGLSVTEQDFTSFMKGAGQSWVEKAAAENSTISISCKENKLHVASAPSAYDAALAADFIRTLLLKKGETFTFETVLSHPSKIEFLKQAITAGYKNYLYFICTVDPQINIQRVQNRAQLGGHNVPESRIIKRYSQSLEVLPSIIPLCHRVYLFDNSTEERSIEPVAEIDNNGHLTLKTGNLPWWVREHVIEKLYSK